MLFWMRYLVIDAMITKVCSLYTVVIYVYLFNVSYLCFQWFIFRPNCTRLCALMQTCILILRPVFLAARFRFTFSSLSQSSVFPFALTALPKRLAFRLGPSPAA